MRQTSPVRFYLLCENLTRMISVLLLAVQRAAEMVRKAKSPVCLLGSQSTLPPTSTHDVVEALEVHRYRAKKISFDRLLLSFLSH
jgi:hypothetical protein